MTGKGVHRFILGHCPACGKSFDAASSLFDAASSLFDEEPPQEGDIMVCFDCATPLILTGDHALRLASTGEMSEIMRNPEAVQTIAAIKDDIGKRTGLRRRH